MASNEAKHPKAGLSLYANLLDPSSVKHESATGTISRAPVVFKQGAEDGLPRQEASSFKQQQQLNAASLQFQPTRRPHLPTQKPKPKISAPKVFPVSSSGGKGKEEVDVDALGSSVRQPGTNALANWTVDAEDNERGEFYEGEKRQRGGRKKRKRNKEEARASQNWDDIYDPSRPGNYEEYKHSDEKISEMREWKSRLYAHRLLRKPTPRADDAGAYDKDQLGGQSNQKTETFSGLEWGRHMPAGLYFGPPSEYGKNTTPAQNSQAAEHLAAQDVMIQHDQPSRSTIIDGNNLNTSGFEGPAQPNVTTAPLPCPSPAENATTPSQEPRFNPLTQVDPIVPPPVISRAPIHYDLPPAPSESRKPEIDIDRASDEGQGNEHEEERKDNAQRSLRPGQKGFAERLMSKYGWTKGTGLGASGSGIAKPLRVQIEKQKKKPDSEGGGYVGPGGKGKIIGDFKSDKLKGERETGKFGAMSEVVVLHGMIDGLDLDAEFETAGDGGLMQEIGEECGEKYGRVERVYIEQNSSQKPLVFVKFTSQLSALRAVNALEGRIFNGNTISAKFYDVDKFESGIYSGA